MSFCFAMHLVCFMIFHTAEQVLQNIWMFLENWIGPFWTFLETFYYAYNSVAVNSVDNAAFLLKTVFVCSDMQPTELIVWFRVRELHTSHNYFQN